MELTIYQLDAFTDRLFGGNPAAVCPLQQWLSDELLQLIAMENNLAETAFIVEEPDGWRIRWFTPCREVDLCGHATLAAAWVYFTTSSSLVMRSYSTHAVAPLECGVAGKP